MPQQTLTPSHETAVSGAVIMGGIAAVSHNTAAQELFLLQGETTNAVVLLRSFRDKTSETPLADLKAAFVHIDSALSHSRFLREKAGGKESAELLHLSMQHFQTILSDIPQISFLSSRMIDSFLEIKDELLETRRKLAA